MIASAVYLILHVQHEIMSGRSNKRSGSLIENCKVKKQKLCRSHSRRRQKPRAYEVRTRLENLDTIYDYTSTLAEFLDSIGAFNAKKLSGKESLELTKFLKSTLVGVDGPQAAKYFLRSKFAAYLVTENIPQTELIRNVIETQFQKSRYPDHVLTYGYEISDDSVNFGTSINMAYFNSQVESLNSPIWLELRDLTSPAVIYFLCSKAALFVPIPNNGLLQITGPSIDVPIKLKKSKEISTANLLSRTTKLPSICLKRANLVLIKKVSIIYANPFFYSSEKKVRHGLRPQRKYKLPAYVNRSNVLDHLNIALPCLDDSVTSETEKMICRVKCALSFMFPLQHKLPSPLSEAKKAFSTQAAPDQFNLYKRGVLDTYFFETRVPKRLNGRPFELVKQLLKRNSKCSFGALLNKFCPNKHDRASVSIAQKLTSQRAEACGEDTIALIRRIEGPLTNDGNASTLDFEPMGPDQSFAASQWEEMKKVDLSTSYEEVFQFCKSVFIDIIPKELIGNPRNWTNLLESVSKFIRLRRYEDLRLSYIAENQTIPEIWTEGIAGHGQTHFYKCRELHLEFLFWLFDQFLTPLLRAHFYATEVSGGANRIVYYRHDVWCSLTEPAFEEFCDMSLEPIPRRIAREIAVTSKIGIPSAFRFVPKPGGGYRGIVCLGRSREKTVYNYRLNITETIPLPSVNRILKDTFLALSFEHWKSGSASIGGAITSVQQLQDRLLRFKNSLHAANNSPTLPNFYVAKVDIKKCYDTIPAQVALQLAEKLLRYSHDQCHKSYFVHKYQQVNIKSSKSIPQSAYKSAPEYATSSATTLDTVRSMAGRTSTTMTSGNLNSKVFVDQVKGNVCTGEELSSLLEDHLTQNLIRVGRTIYKQKVGIPQGSILSTLLCNIVYATLEQQLFRDVEQSRNTEQPLPPYLLVRFVDDFLFISPNRSLTEFFLTRMAKGFPEFGAQIHKDKTVTNFKPGKFNQEFNNQPNYRTVATLKNTASALGLSPAIMTYIGIGINIETLEIVKLPGPSGGTNTSHADSISVRAHGAPKSLVAFKASIFRLVKMRMSHSMINLKLNSWPTVLKNIEAVAHEMGKRIVLATSLWVAKNAKFSSRVVMDTLGEVIALIVERTRFPNYKEFQNSWETDIVRVVAKAMLKIFKACRQHKLAFCIDYLESFC